MKVELNQVKNEINAINPVTGKVEKCEVVKNLKEVPPLKDAFLSDNAGLLAENKIMLKKITFLESRVQTLSVTDWEKYKAL